MWNVPWLGAAIPIAGVILAVTVSWILGRRRRDLSALWPMVPAKFEAANVGGQGNESGGRLDLVFSYTVADHEYRGYFTETSLLRGDYHDLIRSFEQGPLYVRYNPVDPSDYFLDPYRDLRSPGD